MGLDCTHGSCNVQFLPTCQTCKHEESTEDPDPEKDEGDADDLFHAVYFHVLGAVVWSASCSGSLDLANGVDADFV